MRRRRRWRTRRSFISLFMNGWWPVVLLPVVVVLVDRLVIVREERYLEAAFGGE